MFSTMHFNIANKIMIKISINFKKIKMFLPNWKEIISKTNIRSKWLRRKITRRVLGLKKGYNMLWNCLVIKKVIQYLWIMKCLNWNWIFKLKKEIINLKIIKNKGFYHFSLSDQVNHNLNMKVNSQILIQHQKKQKKF